MQRNINNIIQLFQTINKDYATKLEEVGELQAACVKELNHQRYRMSVINGALKRSDTTYPIILLS